MKFRTKIWLVSSLLISLLISACNIGATAAPTEDPGAIQTQAFEIVLTQSSLQQTQTAAAIPLPTNTPAVTSTLAPLPTSSFATNTPFSINTQQPGLTPQLLITPTLGIINTVTTKNGCNDAAYLAEEGYVDGTEIGPNKNITKSFMLQNTGTCNWDEGYSFAFISELSSPGFEGYSIVLHKDKPEEFTKAGNGQTYVLKLQSPKDEGTYKGYWKLKDDLGNYFGPLVWIEVVVVK